MSCAKISLSAIVALARLTESFLVDKLIKLQNKIYDILWDKNRSKLYLRFIIRVRFVLARLTKIRYYSNKNIPSVGANLIGFVLTSVRYIFRWFIRFYAMSLAINPNTKRQFNTFIFFERPTRFLSSGYNDLTFLRYTNIFES